MTYATLSASSSEKTAARQYLSADQELALVAQVKERTELLKLKKDSFTLDEQRIRIKGERAFNTLIDEYRGLIWSIVHRYSFSKRITTEELFQVAIIAVNYAVGKHEQNRGHKFSSWVFLKIKSRFTDLYRSELCLTRRLKITQDSLVKHTRIANEQTPLKVTLEKEKVSLEEKFSECLNQIIMATLPEGHVQALKEQYFEGKPVQDIAKEQGKPSWFIEGKNRRSRVKLKANPRLRELAQEYFS